MLKKRSFGHFFGLGGNQSAARPLASFGFKWGAIDALKSPSPQERGDVVSQMARCVMTGFPHSLGPDAKMVLNSFLGSIRFLVLIYE